MFNLKHKLPKPEEGFSILEVLVSAFVIVGFLLGSLQAITLATVFRVQAQVKSEALNWINQNKTQIEYDAFNIPPPSGTPPVNNVNCNITTFRGTLNTSYPGNITNAALSATTSYNANVTSGITLVNKSTYRVARFYRFSPNPTTATGANSIEVTWHLWDEGAPPVNDGSNPNLNGTGGDSNDRSIAIITTAVAPNPASCP